MRYTTSEINALFKEVKYDLEEVRDTKLVKPIDIGLLQKKIKNKKKKKKKKLRKLFFELIFCNWDNNITKVITI